MWFNNNKKMTIIVIRTVESSGIWIIKKEVELIMNVSWLIKNLFFLMLLDSIRLLLLSQESKEQK